MPKDVKKHANDVTLTNDQDGVAEALEKSCKMVRITCYDNMIYTLQHEEIASLGDRYERQKNNYFAINYNFYEFLCCMAEISNKIMIYCLSG